MSMEKQEIPESKLYHGKPFSKLSNDESVRAVEEGIKPIVFTYNKIDSPLPCIEFEAPTIILDDNNIVKSVFLEKKYIYFCKDQEVNAKRVAHLNLEMMKERFGNYKVGDRYIPKRVSDAYHKELGQLLGYSNEEIEQFVQGQNQRQNM